MSHLVLPATLLALLLGSAPCAIAQTAGTTVDGAVPPAPKGHFQPNASSSPETAAPQPGGVQAVDPASQTQKALQGSDERAVDSICADCLPNGKKKPAH